MTIDCDMHIEVPGLAALLPYLHPYWRDILVQRGMKDLQTYNYPPKMPISARSDWRASGPRPAATLEQVQTELLGPFGIDLAILRPLFGVQLLPSEDMAQALTRALNDYVVAEWLDREPRLRASIVVPMQNPQMAVEEIDRCACDPRFVDVMMLISGEMPIGKRYYWPIYEAAQRHGLAVTFHAGSMFRHPTSAAGGTAFYFEDYSGQAPAFQAQLVSLICEGAIAKFPDLTFVMAESGVTWMPSVLTRIDKFWRGLRIEVPWVKSRPSEAMRGHVRLTLQPFDGPSDPRLVEMILDQLGSDELLLFSTDYPHWQFDGMGAFPEGFSPALRAKITEDNPRAAYRRL